MTEKTLGIKETYSYELLEIQNKLTELESGRVREIYGINMDASIATIAQQLKTMINGLINKIDNQEPSVLDMSDLFPTKRE